MMNRNRCSNLSSIPSLLDMPPSTSLSSTYSTGSTGLGATSYSSSSYGSRGISTGLGLTGGMSVAESFSTPMGYGSYSNTGSSLLGSSSDGLLGNGYGRSSMSGIGGIAEDSFEAKVRLQQAMLAEQKEKSIQEQIEEQLEKQNKKRLEYNRMKRDRENRRRDDKRSDGRRQDDRRRDRANSKDGQKSEGLDDVHVTIKPRSEGRAVSDNTGGRKRNFSDKSRNQPRNNDSKGGSGDSTQQGPWKCHVCVVTCRDLHGYELHMKGRKHTEAMEKMRLVTEFQAQQAMKRLEAERNMKQVQRRNRDEDDHYCRDCLTHYTGDLLAHRRTSEHKEARRTQRPHCRVCNVTFKTPKKYVAHCNTPGHKKVYEAAKKKGEKNIDDEDFVTVDSVGVFDDEDATNDAALLAANIGDNLQTDLGKGFDTTITVTKSVAEDDVIDIDCDTEPSDMAHVDSDIIKSQEYVSDALASSADEDDTIDNLVTAQLMSESDSMVTEESAVVSKPSDDDSTSTPVKKKKKKEDDHSEDLSEYDPNKPVGRHHVIPVWGYFCKPCRQFYQSVGHQGSVLDAHCKTKEHFEALKILVEQGEQEDEDVDYLSMAIAENQEMSM